MDLIKAKTILSRLNAMHQSLESNAHLSTLERDLILNYLRELYEIYHTADVNTIPELKTPIFMPAEKSVEKEVIQKTLEFKFSPDVKTEAPVVENDPPPTIYDPLFKEEIKINVSEQVKEMVPVSASEIKSSMSAPASITSIIPVSIGELFEIKKGNDLSDKLNELPLKDINRGIGLNDKLEIMNTLFGGQKTLFDNTISELNNLKSYEEAQTKLGNGPAIQFKWDHDDRREKAIEFIKLIRRRYL